MSRDRAVLKLARNNDNVFPFLLLHWHQQQYRRTKRERQPIRTLCVTNTECVSSPQPDDLSFVLFCVLILVLIFLSDEFRDQWCESDGWRETNGRRGLWVVIVIRHTHRSASTHRTVIISCQSHTIVSMLTHRLTHTHSHTHVYVPRSPMCTHVHAERPSPGLFWCPMKETNEPYAPRTQ